MVLKRFFSAPAPAPTFLEVEDTNGLGRGVTVEREVVGVAGTLRAPGGLVTLGRAEVDGVAVVRRAGVAETDFSVEVRSALVDGASDALVGLADIPALVFSSPERLSSTELTDCLF